MELAVTRAINLLVKSEQYPIPERWEIIIMNNTNEPAPEKVEI